MKDIDLLREYVTNILLEDDFGGFDMGDSPWGISFGSDKDLYNVFVKPFTDVAQTVAGKTKELSAQAQTLAQVVMKNVVSILLPGIKQDYEQVFAKNKEAVDRIKSQYKSVYDATWTALKDNDVVACAFFMAPEATITAAVFQEAPQAAIKLASILTGGSMDSFLRKLADKLKLNDEVKPLSRDSGPGLPESLIREEQDRREHNVKRILSAMFSKKKFQDSIQSNAQVQQMKKATQKSVNNSLAEIVSTSKKIAAVKTFDDITAITKKPISDIEKLKKLPQQEQQKAVQEMVAVLKKGVKSFYVKNLNAQIAAALKGGIPKDHPFIAIYAKAIEEIKAA